MNVGRRVVYALAIGACLHRRRKKPPGEYGAASCPPPHVRERSQS